MKFLALVWANLRRNPLRTAFTAAAVMAAFTLFGALESARHGLATAANNLHDGTLFISARKMGSLPASYADRIRRFDGIDAVVAYSMLPVSPPADDRTQLTAAAADLDEVIRLYPSLQPDAATLAKWKQTRTAALVLNTVAAKFGWKTGDALPLRSMLPRKDGGNVWEVVVVGTYPRDEQSFVTDLMIRSDYYVESVAIPGDPVALIVARARDYRRSEGLAHSIDATFANAPVATSTTPMTTLARRYVDSMGNVGAILFAVMSASFFTMLLVTGNALAQSVRERMNEIAVLQTIGFSAARIAQLVLAEMLVITLTGGVVGLLLAGLLGVISPRDDQGLFPALSLHSMMVGVVLMLFFALVSAALPVLQAFRAPIVDNLRCT